MSRILGYVRVSTDEQSTERQQQSIREYARRNFDADDGDLKLYHDKETGTDTERRGYQQLMNHVEDDDRDAEALIVHSVTRISRSITDLERTAERIAEAGVEFHIVSEGLSLKPGQSDPFQRALFQLLGVFAEFEAAMNQQRTKEGIASRRKADAEYHHGRPPLGFDKADGKLIEGDSYHQVCAVLDMVAKDNMSKRAAAKRLNTSWTTVDRCLKKGELYGL